MPKKEPPAKPAPVRIPPDLLLRIDEQRMGGQIPRTVIVRTLLEEALTAREKQQATSKSRRAAS